MKLKIAFLGLVLAGCIHPNSEPASPLSPERIDARIAELMRANDVKGLALAVIRDGQVAYVHAYGERDVERHLPLRPDTVMYGASLTKATFATFIMQLVDGGRLDLDKPLGDYLPKPLPDYERYADLKDDPRWRKITARIVLSHTTGFANFAFLEPDEKLRIHWDPGMRYGYSGEGFHLLQFVLENGLGLDVGAEMQRRIFVPLGMSRTNLTWRDDFAGNLAQGYALDGKVEGHRQRKNVRAAGSMDTTIADWSKFLAAVARGDLILISAKSKAEMTRLQIAIHSAHQFPTLDDETTTANDAIKLGYGLGWGVFETPMGHAFFKEGGDDFTSNYALCIAPTRDCVLILSNSARARGIFKAVVDLTMGETNLPWEWEGYRPYDMK